MKKIFLLITLFSSTQLFAAPVLVDTDWLANNINKKNIVVIDTSDHTQYMRFHIPSAIHIDYSEITYKRKKDKVSVQVPNDYFIKLLSQQGITNDSYIIIYDDMGGLNAGRLFWQLEQIGHKNVSVLNGGLVKWVLEHKKVDNKNHKLLPAIYKANKTGKRDNLANIDTFKSNNNLIIDARSKEEYTGHPRVRRSGHIPEAVLWDWQNNVDFENSFQIKTASQIMKEQRHINFDNKNQEVIAYCRSGHRASQTYLTLRNMGFEKVKLYDGSMSEYSQNKNAPLDLGCTTC